mgnify:CR=1 FL=1|jgi:predicted membrane protein
MSKIGGGFEARNMDVIEIDDPGLLSERVWGKLTLRHLIYLFSALLFAWMGSRSGSIPVMIIAMVVAGISIFGAIYPAKTIKFEALLAGFFYHIITGTENTSKKEKPKKKERKKTRKKIKVKKTRRIKGGDKEKGE